MLQCQDDVPLSLHFTIFHYFPIYFHVSYEQHVSLLASCHALLIAHLLIWLPEPSLSISTASPFFSLSAFTHYKPARSHSWADYRAFEARSCTATGSAPAAQTRTFVPSHRPFVSFPRHLPSPFLLHHQLFAVLLACSVASP